GARRRQLAPTRPLMVSLSNQAALRQGLRVPAWRVRSPQGGQGERRDKPGGSAVDDLHGYLNVLKPPGWTSHDVVARLRRLSGQRRIGHAGTLDPAAVGVLPVAFGRATRTTSSTAWDRKLYWADIRLGSATDTDDDLGKVIATGSPDELKIDDVTAALGRFVGAIEQRPPAYS